MELVIVTGMSGAGKSTVATVLEDIGYYCVDNIPPRIITAFVDMSHKGAEGLERLAIVTDMRGGELFKDITEVLDKLDGDVDDIKILFLEAEVGELVRRYKENRRSHPMISENVSLTEAVSEEKNVLADIRQRADYILNTTYISTSQLKRRIVDLFGDKKSGGLKIHCMSFGFKHGPAAEADLVFDVRCLPNPFYDPELRALSGLDSEVKDYVLASSEAKVFAERLLNFIDHAVPLYSKEGKSSLVIAFGCTGGQHRSVTFAELVGAHLKEKGFICSTGHRDMQKNHYR